MSDREILDRAWALVSLPMAHPSYTQAVSDLLSDGHGGVCARALQMFELAIEVASMRDGSLLELVSAWSRDHVLMSDRRRAPTEPATSKAMRGVA
jgi:hypothetical protein